MPNECFVLFCFFFVFFGKAVIDWVEQMRRFLERLKVFLDKWATDNKYSSSNTNKMCQKISIV